MIVYKIQNKINEKIYIGITTRKLNRRIYDHIFKSRQPNIGGIAGAIKKYGIQNFDIIIIDVAYTHDELNEKEVYYIKKYNSMAPNGYNLYTGGLHHQCSEITREKFRQQGRKRKHSDETRAKMSATGKIKTFTDEHKKNITLALKGRKHSLEHISHLPQNQKGFHAGENHPRAKLTNSQVVFIKDRIKKGIPVKDISIDTGIPGKDIHRIKSGIAYRYV